MKSKIKPGDKIEVTKGKDLGKTGLVKRVYTSSNKVLVEGINIVKRHLKPRANFQGGIIPMEKPLALANVQLICPSCHKKTRIAYEIKDGQKQRICKKCGVIITQEKKETKKTK